MSDQAKSRFPELLQLKLPRGANEALDRLATAQCRTKSEMARQLLLAEIEAHGLYVAATAPAEVTP